MTDAARPHCARCGRVLTHPVEVAGMVLGRTCAGTLGRAISSKRRASSHDRREQRLAEEFKAAQLPLI